MYVHVSVGGVVEGQSLSKGETGESTWSAGRTLSIRQQAGSQRWPTFALMGNDYTLSGFFNDF